ncbi:unnamed protein product [Rotaria sp. Silwood2]|nr:unnamed protein product [Rotaria sp. Silwood2]CAF3435147.1 unnamed protein product [Rotaria sp. Silwood2]CAF4192669.1 unnamed protein product [Rotaria sp. Silwood2]
MCEHSIHTLNNDHFQERSNESPRLVNEIDLVSVQFTNLSVTQRSCFTILNKWFRDIFQRIKHLDNENNQQSEEITNHQQVELNAGKSRRDNKMTKNFQQKIQQQNLFPFQRPYRTIKIKDKSSVSIACNDKHIILKQEPNLCLFDKQLTIVKEIPWTYAHVDICWSSTPDQFILITEKTISTFDDNTMILHQCQIDLINDKEWSFGSCSDTSLYLSTGDMSTTLYEYTLRPTIAFVREWQLLALYSRYEGTLTFTCANDKIALIISNIHAFQRCFGLYSSITFERLWSIPLNAVVHCCSINNDQWIVMELLQPRLLHFSSDGKILQEYKIKTPSLNIIWNAIQLDKDTIATLTMDNLNLHKLS